MGWQKQAHWQHVSHGVLEQEVLTLVRLVSALKSPVLLVLQGESVALFAVVLVHLCPVSCSFRM